MKQILGGPPAGRTSGPPQSSSPVTPDSTGPGDPTSQPPASDDPNNPPTTRCPAVTAAALLAANLGGDLKLRLYIRASTSNASDSEVWICENADGLLVYQGHVRNGPLSTADNGRNSLLLVEGIKGSVATEGTGYVAVNPNGRTSTEYHVSRERLAVVDKPSNRERVYTVNAVYPP
jgi:hypothetical protein